MNARSSIASTPVDPDMPDEIDFSGAVRGEAGRHVLVRWARFRRALRDIARTSSLESDPVRAAREMQALARQALEEDTPDDAR